MVLAGLYLTVFVACGVMMLRWLLPRHSPLARTWLGVSLGLLLMMWLPALCAFALDFTAKAHAVALVPLALITAGCWLGRDRRPVRPWREQERTLLWQALAVVLPLTVLSGYLQYTHILRVDEWGNWNVGQSTYGDLPMHMAFVTGLKNAPFPAEYPFYPGTQLSYPFLADSLSTTFYLMGCSLQLSMILPGTLMMALCFLGVMILAREMTLGRKTVVLATLLFFLNGGLGFLYDFDQAAGFEPDGTLTVLERLEHILTGYYKTPTNQPTPNNLRWSNVIADLMIPQRTLLGGWCMVIPCFYLLYTLFAPEKRGGELLPAEDDIAPKHAADAMPDLRGVILLGVWGGSLPLIHTHSFVALALCSLGVMIYDLIHDPQRWQLLRRYVLYGGIAAVLAVPQLVLFTFAQTFQGGETHTFMTFQFNWVNNPGGNGMLDFYLWFYVKNIGLPFVALVLALFEKNSHTRRIFAGALVIILAAELIRFQPNEYDNNKLLYLAWLMCCMIVADWCAMLWRRLKGLRARPVIAVAAAVMVFLSAGLTLWRECLSTYQAFSASSVAVAEFVRDETDEDSVFLCGTQHLNPVSSIAGRRTVCGPDLWLYWHGFDTSQRKADIRRFYTDPAGNVDVLHAYDVDYILLSSYERSDYDVDVDALDELFPVVFENGEATVYQVPEG